MKFTASSAESEILNHLLKHSNRGELEKESSNVISNFFFLVRGKNKDIKQTKLKLTTAISKAKIARRVLDSMVADDARISTDLSNVLEIVNAVQQHQTREMKNIANMTAAMQRQFGGVTDSLGKVHDDLSRRQLTLGTRVEGLETGVAKCFKMLEQISGQLALGGRQPAPPMDELSQAAVSQINVLLRKVYLLQQELKGAAGV